MYFRAKVIIERVETRRPLVRSRDQMNTEAVYDELRVEVAGGSVDVVLSKAINLAQAEQSDRDARALRSGEQNKAARPDPFADGLEDEDEEEEG